MNKKKEREELSCCHQWGGSNKLRQVVHGLNTCLYCNSPQPHKWILKSLATGRDHYKPHLPSEQEAATCDLPGGMCRYLGAFCLRRIRRLGQLLTRRRSLPKDSTVLTCGGLLLAQDNWATPAHRKKASSPGLTTYMWSFKDRLTMLFLSRGLNDVDGSLRPLKSSQDQLQGS